nr:AraC family transcriptional regulator [Pleionea sp. CnH1-48]
MYHEELGIKLSHHLIQRYSQTRIDRRNIDTYLSPLQRKKIRSFIHEHLDKKITVGSLAKEIGLSDFHFARQFKKTFLISPAQFILRLRLEEVKRLLKSESYSLSDIAIKTGFSHQSHMTQYFKKQFSTTPLTYLNGPS